MITSNLNNALPCNSWKNRSFYSWSRKYIVLKVCEIRNISMHQSLNTKKGWYVTEIIYGNLFYNQELTDFVWNIPWQQKCCRKRPPQGFSYSQSQGIRHQRILCSLLLLVLSKPLNNRKRYNMRFTLSCFCYWILTITLTCRRENSFSEIEDHLSSGEYSRLL